MSTRVDSPNTVRSQKETSLRHYMMTQHPQKPLSSLLSVCVEGGFGSGCGCVTSCVFSVFDDSLGGGDVGECDFDWDGDSCFRDPVDDLGCSCAAGGSTGAAEVLKAGCPPGGVCLGGCVRSTDAPVFTKWPVDSRPNGPLAGDSICFGSSFGAATGTDVDINGCVGPDVGSGKGGP